MNHISQERIIAFLSVLKKHGLKAFANKMLSQHKVNYSNYKQTQVDILIRGSLKTNLIFLDFLQKYLKKLPPKQILILLNLALYEYFFLSTETFAVLNEWVNICPSQFKKLVNAVLRNVSREYPEKKLEINKNLLLPVFIQNSLQKAIPDKLEKFLDDFLKTPSIFIISKNKLRKDFLESFEIKTIYVGSQEYFYTKSSKVLKELKKEFIYIQDLAPQIVLDRTFKHFKLTKNFSVLDMCSAPGGKTINVALKQVKPENTKLCLTEKNPYRIKDLEDNLNRLNIKPYKIKTIDAGSKNYPKIIKEESHEHEGFDLIILDAPCSSVGTIKRHPEILLRFNKELTLQHQSEQLKLLQNAFRTVKKGSYILYTVCSFTEEETLSVVEIFKANFDVQLLESDYIYESFDDVSSDLHFYAIFKRN